MKSPLKNIKLTSYDELLNPEIAQENGEKIVELPIAELHTCYSPVQSHERRENAGNGGKH